MRFLSLLILFVSATARANPVIADPVDIYMSSERLSIVLGPTEAEFRGTFTFKSVGHVSYVGQTVSVQVPIWFPAEVQASNAPIAAFWSVFDRAAHDLVSLKEKQRVEEALSLKVVVGKEELRAGPLLVSGRGDTRRIIPQSWEERGCRVLLFHFAVSPDVISNGTPVTVFYRQPLLYSGGERKFVYVPIFAHLPKGASTSDTNRYAITLTAAPNCDLTVTNGALKSAVEAGQHLTLSPKGLQAIRATVRPRADGSGSTLIH